MKKLFKILIFNFLFIIVLFLVIDITIFYKLIYSSWFYNFSDNKLSYLKFITRPLIKNQIENDINKLTLLNNTHNKEMHKNSIVLFGCSFTEGISLEDKERFDYKIAKYTGRPTYNRARGGWGTQHALFQLKTKSFYNIISSNKNKPEYIIYTYIPDHVNRIFVAMNSIIYGGLPTFVYKKGKYLSNENIETLTFRFPTLINIKQALYYNFTTNKQKSDLLKSHLLEMKKEIDKNLNINSNNRFNKDETKFIILVYDEDYHILSIADELRKNKIQIIYANEITKTNLNNINFTISAEDPHPNGKAWNLIVPKLINRIESDKNNTDIYSTQYELLSLKKYNINENLKNEFSINYLFQQLDIDPHPESIGGIDKKLINEEKICKWHANIAYFFFSIGHLIKTSGLSFFSKPFYIIAHKINKENPFYQI